VNNTATGTNALKWDMATKTITNITTMFGIGLGNNPDKPDNASWTANPDPATNYRFVKVLASVPVPSTFMQAFQTLVSSNGGSSNNVQALGVGVRCCFLHSPSACFRSPPSLRTRTR
jgi:hypothetical protein